MKRFLSYLLFLIPFISSAQSNFQKGYMLTNTNDTIQGYINYRERSVNPNSFQFKAQPNSSVQTFSLTNSAGYAVGGMEKFQRFIIDISMSSRNVSNLSVGPEFRSKRDTVFLKVIQEGENVTLYLYQDDIKSRYYIKANRETVPAELVYELYLDPEHRTNIISAGKYGGQLLDLLIKYNAGTTADTQKLRGIKYVQDDLLKVTALINKQEPVKLVKGARTRFFAGGGLALSKTAYKGNHPLADAAAKSKTSVSPIFTAGMDLFANPTIGKLIYRVELTFLQAKTDISRNTDVPAQAVLRHIFNQYTVMLAPQVIYNIYNTDHLKLYAGAGFSVNVSKYTDNQSTRYNSLRDEINLTENEIKLEGFTASIPVRIGAVFSRRIEFSAIYLPASGVAKYNEFSIGMKKYTIGLNYLFGK
jgi:hypothetical protein